ncbi:related to cercosporin resistance protein [Rhynchosporium agropyri]|uniref:Related to cercosporin resistance protein n=1 Tax=Rhynchosporium agropyri TaxID=914238 RepID=A0A1E1LME9_9HELO|nr:related to cercosporin resistance protein [Rhynchosporium agropyri]
MSSRVAEMEEKLGSLLALVAANVANQSLNITPATQSPSCIQEHSPMPTDHVSHQSSNISATGSKPLSNPELSCTLMPDSSITRFASAYDTPPSSSNPSEQSFPQQNAVIVCPIFDTFRDVISKGLIGLNEVEDALRLFRSKQNTFPFVVIPVNLSMDSLRRQRPFLFLAIMCCAKEHNAKLQQHIELELKDNLSRRILVNGEKSLDLLQGILIYLTWYHLYFHPDREQIYQLSQMAVAMAVDLGLDKPVRPAPKGLSASNNMPFITSHPLPSADIEGMRAFLGCYFLTTSICQVLRKPSNMKHNERLKYCTRTVEDSGTAQTDYLIPYMLRIRQLSEEVNQAFNYDSNEELPQLDPIRIELLGRAFERQLDYMEDSFPQEIWDNASIKMSFHHLRIHVNEVGFHAGATAEVDLISRLAASSWYHSASRNDCLMRCLKATKTYLDHFLLLSDIEISNLVTVDLLQTVYAALILVSFSTGLDAPTLDQHKVRRAANISYCFDAISSRFAHLISMQDPAANVYMQYVKMLFQTSKSWYTQMLHDSLQLGPPRLLFTDIISTMTGKCSDSVAADAMPEKNEEVQWAEMLSEWVASSAMDPAFMSEDGTFIQFQA